MAVGCGAQCAKSLLIICNLIFWVAGVAALGLGIWIHLDKGKGHLYNLVTIDTVGPDAVNQFKYLLIGLGGVTALVALLGCCGACKESKCMLGTHFAFLLAVFLAFAALGILAVTSQATLISDVEGRLQKRLRTGYNQTDQGLFTVAMDFVQVERKCCGIRDSTDYFNSKWRNSTFAKTPELKEVPDTCCVIKNENDKTAFLHPRPKNSQLCQSSDPRKYGTEEDGGPFRHTVGCMAEIQRWFDQETTILLCASLGLAGLLVFGMLFTVCLCRNVEEEETA
ncbi:CD82 antigen-like [Amphibalanus amphitrite]|uniref:CD82 antigen-like n=1 Tax=Amphibalanus amphitrite TaxID=1232801 RepID=UPI001C929459|nr:CD82 antigen-like [Amphibalanus amphitrite]